MCFAFFCAIQNVLRELLDGSTKRCESKLRQLEALFTKGDTDDGNAVDDAREEEAERQEQTAEDDPDYVCNGVLAKIRINIGAEGPNRNASHLECLLAEGNTNDGDAPQKANEEPANSGEKTGQNEPNKIANKLHTCFSFFNIGCTYINKKNKNCQYICKKS